jgi:sulfur carrier protein ThiS
MSENLPLSAPSSSNTIRLTLDLVRAGRVTRRELDVPVGTPLKRALRDIGLAPEGCAVLDGDRPVPLDTPLDSDRTLSVVSTFSGG